MKNTTASALRVARLDGLSEIAEADWEKLDAGGSPFLEHFFLAQLEARGLVGPGTGWRPCHLAAWRGKSLRAAMPLYEKSNSYGEFVFDWSWADAYLRAGRPYFPKLVGAVPFTPVPGRRCLMTTGEDPESLISELLGAARDLAAARGASSLHILFPDTRQASMLGKHGLALRADCRFLWKNAGFADFDDFLETFTSRQRKNIRRERRKIRAHGLRFSWITGEALAELDWQHVHGLCARTFQLRGQMPYLDAGFFEALACSMPDRLLVNLAHREDRTVAAAIFFRDQDTLYGRYWGAEERVEFLHFECCYYQGIEYAIRNGLSRFDPGTQGEHKLRRGFMPVASWSLHWFADRQFDAAISRWLQEERRLVRAYIADNRAAMPFRMASEEPEHWP